MALVLKLSRYLEASQALRTVSRLGRLVMGWRPISYGIYGLNSIKSTEIDEIESPEPSSTGPEQCLAGSVPLGTTKTAL